MFEQTLFSSKYFFGLTIMCSVDLYLFVVNTVLINPNQNYYTLSTTVL